MRTLLIAVQYYSIRAGQAKNLRNNQFESVPFDWTLFIRKQITSNILLKKSETNQDLSQAPGVGVGAKNSRIGLFSTGKAGLAGLHP
jgi:hypothetical protein